MHQVLIGRLGFLDPLLLTMQDWSRCLRRVRYCAFRTGVAKLLHLTVIITCGLCQSASMNAVKICVSPESLKKFFHFCLNQLEVQDSQKTFMEYSDLSVASLEPLSTTPAACAAAVAAVTQPKLNRRPQRHRHLKHPQHPRRHWQWVHRITGKPLFFGVWHRKPLVLRRFFGRSVWILDVF